MNGIRSAALAAMLGLTAVGAPAVTTAEFASRSQAAPASAATPPAAPASKPAGAAAKPHQPGDDKVRVAPKSAR